MLARTLAHDGAAPRAVYCSDLHRARRTAEVIAVHLEVPVIPDAGFRERHGGDWQGHTVTEIDERWPGLRAAWRRGELRAPPGGETDDVVLARFNTALTRALAHVGEGMLCIVTHHGVLRLVATDAGGDVHALIPNLGGFWFDVDGTRLRDPVPTIPLIADDERPAVE